MRARDLALIAGGGAIGALARYGLADAFPPEPGRFPVTTFGINIVGAFLLGALLEWLVRHRTIEHWARFFAGVGVLGAFTTFSTFATEIVVLARDGHGAVAALYAVASVIAGLAAVVAGLVTAGVAHAAGAGGGRVVIVVGVALAGALGAPARYVVESLVRRVRPGTFPLGTFLVNVSGSLALGLIVGFAERGTLDADARTVVGIGFLGAYTTFSTYAYETVRLAEEGARRSAAVYAIGSALVAGAAAALGLALTGAL